MRIDKTVLFIIICISGLQCDKPLDPIDAFTPELIVEGYLTAGKSFQSISLKQSISGDDLFDYLYYRDDPHKWISGAQITIATDSWEVNLVEDSEQAGIYRPSEQDRFVVTSNTTYSLEVQYQEEQLSASTTVPGAIHINIISPFNGTNIDSGDTVILGIDSAEKGFGYAVTIDERDEYNNSWQLIQHNYFSEGYFFTLEERIVIPNNYFRYYGAVYVIKVYNLDRNLFDLYVTQSRSSWDPEPVAMYIDGGLGIFGSYSADSVFITVTKHEK